MTKPKIPGGETSDLKLTLDENGIIIDAKEKGQDLVYADPNATMVGTTGLQRNPCRWVKINGKWYCI